MGGSDPRWQLELLVSAGGLFFFLLGCWGWEGSDWRGGVGQMGPGGAEIGGGGSEGWQGRNRGDSEQAGGGEGIGGGSGRWGQVGQGSGGLGPAGDGDGQSRAVIGGLRRQAGQGSEGQFYFFVVPGSLIPAPHKQ